MLRSDWEAERGHWASFVNQDEEAISREHTLWRASRSYIPHWAARRLSRRNSGP